MYIELLDLSFLELIIRLALGLVIGFSIGLTGVGGGVLVLPALTLILGIDPIKAVGTTSFYAFLTKISATVHHAKLKTIDWGTSFRFLAGAVPAAALVSLWVSGKGANEAFQHGLKDFIVGVVIFSVIIMILNMAKQSRTSLENEERSLAGRINGHPLTRTTLCVLMGVIIGGLLGATSIGGGVLIVPMLIILFNLSTSQTVGSSIFIAVVLTLVTSFIYGKGGEVDKVTAIIMAVGSLSGVYYGSKLSARIPDRLLQGIVISLILTGAVLMLLNQGH
jgi:uncharacterized membrane protein YfcA